MVTPCWMLVMPQLFRTAALQLYIQMVLAVQVDSGTHKCLQWHCPPTECVLQCRSASGSRTPEASPLIAGLELGLYNFAASGLQAVGLQYTTATRGSLLILVQPWLLWVISV